MPTDAKFKSLVRARMERTGESYTQARLALILKDPTDPAGGELSDALSTRDRIRFIMGAHPTLSYEGFKPRVAKRRLTQEEHDAAIAAAVARFAEKREYLLTDDCVQQVEACLAMLQLVQKDPTFRVSSYALKHVVERWRRAGKPQGREFYVANGALIVAALIAGFNIEHEDGDINCSVLIDPDDLIAIENGMTPTQWRTTSPFVAWLLAQAHRDDLVGDLARDAEEDLKFPRYGDTAQIRAYLSRRSDPSASRAMRFAELQYLTVR